MTIVPIFRSFDEALTRGFYIHFLGFDVVFEHRFEPGTPLYLGLSFDPGSGADRVYLHVSEHFGDASPGASCRIEIANVHDYCAALNAKGYKYARPGVQRQPWGMDDMTISDPAGNKLIFCTDY